MKTDAVKIGQGSKLVIVTGKRNTTASLKTEFVFLMRT